MPDFTAPMLHTALALLLAHLLADFVLQTNAMVAYKKKPAVFALHIVIVAATSLVLLGGAWKLVLLIAAAHLVVDAVKTAVLPDTLSSFLADQAAHLLSIALAVVLMPDAFQSGIWADYAPALTAPATIACGLIVASLAGGPAVGLLMLRFGNHTLPEGLENAGRMIGQLERSLIFLMVMIGEPAGVGFLIAAKSVLRFDTASQNQKASEYVIIGTLASFGWAMAAAYATKFVLTLAAS